MTIFNLGDVLAVQFPQRLPNSREQEGFRPAITVGLPDSPRFPVLIVVPLTTDRGQQWANHPYLYPKLPAETIGLRSNSIALLDQVTSIDEQRVYKQRGTLSADVLRPILHGLHRLIPKS
ncbi:type II toxin-antitoxin system PemK/MazF family toxin [Candidatus Cyanaurora vandensis]|uniref:type II toxin-antitoxin system PemK/MazF family toxin n=1 Tax=Candidatus Cyanaurora vandensis TaxID=2714958 RepID=UPI0037BF7A8C